MKPIAESERPLLFLGVEIRRFLQERRDSRRRKLKDDEFYCLRCQEVRQTDPGNLKILDTKRRLGGGKLSIQIQGKCPKCNATICRFCSFPGPIYDLFAAMIPRANKGLEGNDKGNLNIDLEKGHNHENER